MSYAQADIIATTYSDDGININVSCTVKGHFTGQPSYTHNDDGTVTEEDTFQPVTASFPNNDKKWLALKDNDSRVDFCQQQVMEQNSNVPGLRNAKGSLGQELMSCHKLLS